MRAASVGTWRRRVLVAAIGLALGLPARAGADGEAARLQGERMYRLGLLPSGERMKAALPGGVEAPGTTFSCASCHTRSGLGSVEEGVWRPPVNGTALFRPLFRDFRGLSQDDAGGR